MTLSDILKIRERIKPSDQINNKMIQIKFKSFQKSQQVIEIRDL